MNALDIARRLIELTEAQLDAAKQLNGEELDRLTQERAGLLFDLKVASTEADAERLGPELRRLRHLEGRLAAVASTVLDLIGAPPPSTDTYGRSGRYGG